MHQFYIYIYFLESLSIQSSSSSDIEMIDLDKTPSNDTESNNGSDEDDYTKKKQHSSVDDDIEFENEELDGTDLRNIWRKRRNFSNNQMSSIMQTELTTTEQNNSNNTQIQTTNDYQNIDKYPQTNSLYIRPHDHQVPTILPVQHDDLMAMSNRLVITKIFLI
jgi:hypothetical protein